LLLARGNVGANRFECFRERLDLGAGLSERGLLRFGALETGEFLILEPIGFSRSELNFMLDGRGLLGRLDGVELGAKARRFLAMGLDLAFQTRAERVFAAERGAGFAGLALCSGESGLRFGDFAGQRTRLLGKAGAIEFDRLQLYEAFNQCLHR
jgi:hypothetical protein